MLLATMDIRGSKSSPLVLPVVAAAGVSLEEAASVMVAFVWWPALDVRSVSVKSVS